MRKALAVGIALMLIFVLAACDNQKEEPTTLAPITQYVSTTEPSSAAPSEDPSYVFTTDAGQTVPWMETTRFEFDLTNPSGTTSVVPSDYDIDFQVSTITPPNVVTSEVATSASTTKVADDNTTLAPSTSAGGEDTSTTAGPSKGVSVIVNSTSVGNGVIGVEIDTSNWTGDLAAGSASVTIMVDGTESSTTPTLTIPAKKNGLGFYDCTIDVSVLELQPGSVVIFTIPAGSIKNAAGTEHNLSYSGTIQIVA